MAIFWKSLLLFAVLLMPFGMVPAGAATPMQHDPAAMPMQHCPDQAPKQAHKAFGACTMACSSALPAMASSQVGVPQATEITAEPAPMAQLHGVHPETATPPPKLS